MNLPESNQGLAKAFEDYEAQLRVQNFKVASFLASVFMPAGLPLDWIVYRDKASSFFLLRVLSSILTLTVWWIADQTIVGRKYFKYLGIVLASIPTFFICWMIVDSGEGALSPYYAGISLVLVGAGLVLRWGVWDSLAVFVIALLLYLGACVVGGPTIDYHYFGGNLWFMCVTGVFVVVGSGLSQRLRFSEFTLRYELERNRKIIEENNRKLVELDHAKSRFFANISHELRTPLTLLLAPIDALRVRFGDLLDNEGQELIATMRDNGMRLLKLINDLLDLVRLEEGRVKIERSPIDLDSLVRGLAASLQHTATTREVALSVEVEPDIPRVMLDRDKLEKTLLNLLFNALKFTNAGGGVVLSVSRRDDFLEFSVADTGIGISKENVGQLFQRFWQADGSARRKQQGAGIGLSLVKEFTEAQGGKVTVDSELGRGTTFTVQLPFLPAAEAESESTGAEAIAADSTAEENEGWLHSLYREAQLSPAGGERSAGGTVLYARRSDRSGTVLVADDEPDMLRFIRAQLGFEHRVLSAQNGQEAVEIARQAQPAVIVLDMMMPVMDGIEACGLLRKDESTAHIPILMLTARADEQTKLAALAAGANDFVAKPFSIAELHVRVRNLMEGYYSRVELAKQNQTLEDTIEVLRETEMQLLQSEKLASIGELSAGMSHEVKNPLNYALTGIYALKSRGASLPASQRAEYEELVMTVEEGVRRVMETVNTLRELVHPQVENRQEFKVEDVVDAALRLLRAEWKGRVAVHTDISADTILYANKSMILLVFLNLLKNSMDALRDATADIPEPTIWIEGEELDDRTIVTVRDNGPGIPVENQSRLFDILGMGDLAGASTSVDSEPQGRVFQHFFSTKAPGAGMGMGLSICRRIVRAHGGAISLRTEPGTMCEFTLEFPTHRVVEAFA